MIFILCQETLQRTHVRKTEQQSEVLQASLPEAVCGNSNKWSNILFLFTGLRFAEESPSAEWSAWPGFCSFLGIHCPWPSFTLGILPWTALSTVYSAFFSWHHLFTTLCLYSCHSRWTPCPRNTVISWLPARNIDS